MDSFENNSGSFSFGFGYSNKNDHFRRKLLGSFRVVDGEFKDSLGFILLKPIEFIFDK